MNSQRVTEPSFRVAFRQQGDAVYVYLAKMDTMKGAQLLATFAAGVLALPGIFGQAQELMKSALDELVKAETGERVVAFELRDAPEHEKAGHA